MVANVIHATFTLGVRMEDLESPIKPNGTSATPDSSVESYGEVIMDENPTGVSDDLQSKHISPLKSETSSVENSKLYTTTRNWSDAANGCIGLKRSSSMPDVGIDIRDNYFFRKSPAKSVLRRTYSASKLMEKI